VAEKRAAGKSGGAGTRYWQQRAHAYGKSPRIGQLKTAGCSNDSDAMNPIPAFALTAEQALAIDTAGINSVVAGVLYVSLVTGFIGTFFGFFKNRKALGLFLGMVLGPVGWLLMIFAREGKRDEGLMDGFTALVFGGLIITGGTTLSWERFIRPLLARVVEAEAQAAPLRAERARRVAQLAYEARVRAAIESKYDPHAQQPTSRPTPDALRLRMEIEQKYGMKR
jgi:hypothetical protein